MFLELMQSTDPNIAGPAITVGAVGLSGTAVVKYFLGRFDRLEQSLQETREDVASIMGALNIKRDK